MANPVCRTGEGVKTHCLRGEEWREYGPNVTVCGLPALYLEPLPLMGTITVTCKRCVRGKNR